MRNRLLVLIGSIVALIVAAVPGWCVDPTSLSEVLTTGKTDMLANVWPVAGAALGVMVAVVGIGMAFKWIKKSAKSS